MELRLAPIIRSPGAATGPALALSAPISFWGGVDPKSGDIIDARHPDVGRNIAGKVLCLPGTIGSSSASAVLLELVHAGRAPAAILMPQPDAILLMGLIIAREMGWAHPPAFRLTADAQGELQGRVVTISPDGVLIFD
jgi:predicted aconitase with swiveling domain